MIRSRGGVEGPANHFSGQTATEMRRQPPSVRLTGFCSDGGRLPGEIGTARDESAGFHPGWQQPGCSGAGLHDGIAGIKQGHPSQPVWGGQWRGTGVRCASRKGTDNNLALQSCAR